MFISNTELSGVTRQTASRRDDLVSLLVSSLFLLWPHNYILQWINAYVFFCPQDQYDNLAAHTHKGIEFLDKYGSFVKERCAIELEYAGKLR